MGTPPDSVETSSNKTMARELRLNQDRQEGQPRVAENYRLPLLYRVVAPARKLVSSNRARYKYQNIDLDLAYITDRIIAVGYPATGFEALYRNSLPETCQFLYRRHGSHRVKVFNLRGGYFYNPRHFDSNVVCFDMKDHHPPSLELMAPFCREAKEWLDADPHNVIAVHCKAGKGRTGVMICALLIYIRFYDLPRQILDYYSIIRTKNNKGVTIPSQRRYIYYFHTLREKQLNYFPLRMQLMGIYVERPPKTSGGGSKIKIIVTNNSADVFKPPTLSISKSNYQKEMRSWRDSQDPGFEEASDTAQHDCEGEQGTLVSKRAYCFMVPEDSPVFVEGDVRVDLRESGFGLFNRFPSKKIGHVWFNTMFVCHGAPLGEKFVYGDKRWPYEGSDTSIGRLNGLIGREEALPKVVSDEENPWDIVQPPMLNVHSPLQPLNELYGQYGMPAPRDHIASVLHDAHRRSIVKDEYNNRRKDIIKDSYSELGNRGEIKGVGGPFQIPLKKGEHILTFPVYEIDRAVKTDKIDNGMKMHVVLKCVDSSDEKLVAKSEVFCDKIYHHEETQNVQTINRRSSKYPPKLPDFGLVGAEMNYPPVVRYAVGETYDGVCHKDLKNDQFATRKIAGTKRYCRYFYRQRDTSRSKYPDPVHECPLTGARYEISHDRDNNDASSSKEHPPSCPSSSHVGPTPSTVSQPGPTPNECDEQCFTGLLTGEPHTEKEGSDQVPKGEVFSKRGRTTKRAVDIASTDYDEKEPSEDPESELRETAIALDLDNLNDKELLDKLARYDPNKSEKRVDHLTEQFLTLIYDITNKKEAAADSLLIMKNHTSVLISITVTKDNSQFENNSFDIYLVPPVPINLR